MLCINVTIAINYIIMYVLKNTTLTVKTIRLID